ncbi:hypothetical protein B0H16DRAFT_1562630 [Mycena metata]|uniref:Uncharacterized protein n=1 Tax=Mycena metata TaxID=1033252 RepID=A0AAD7IGX7_9AGAR|nr:hypothetical protein B0H16DRAFT_1562630 [Mycena metata]
MSGTLIPLFMPFSGSRSWWLPLSMGSFNFLCCFACALGIGPELERHVCTNRQSVKLIIYYSVHSQLSQFHFPHTS